MASTSNTVSDPCDTLPTPRHIRIPGRSGTSRSPSPIPSPGTSTPTLFEVVRPEEVHLADIDAEEHASDALDAQIESSASKEGAYMVSGGGPQPKAPVQPPARKLCVRHQRMADEGTNLQLQKVSPLDSLEPIGLSVRRALMRYKTLTVTGCPCPRRPRSCQHRLV